MQSFMVQPHSSLMQKLSKSVARLPDETGRPRKKACTHKQEPGEGRRNFFLEQLDANHAWDRAQAAKRMAEAQERVAWEKAGSPQKMTPCEPVSSGGRRQRAVYKKAVGAGRGANTRPRNAHKVLGPLGGGRNGKRCSNLEGNSDRAEDEEVASAELGTRKRSRQVERRLVASDGVGHSRSSEGVGIVARKSDEDFDKALAALREYSSTSTSPRAPIDAAARSMHKKVGEPEHLFGIFDHSDDAGSEDSLEEAVLWLISAPPHTDEVDGDDSEFEPLHLFAR